MFWPRQIRSKYAVKLEDFKDPKNKPQAVKALNELVTDALRHAEDGLEYMFRLRNPDVFRFCAIPRVMAIATLAEIYNNHRVPTGVVKVRQGVVAQYMAGTNSMSELGCAYLGVSQKISESFLAIVNELHHLEGLGVCDALEMKGDFGKVESHPSLQTIKLLTNLCTCKAFTSALRLWQLQELWIKILKETTYRPYVARVPALPPQSKLTTLRCKGKVFFVVDFWDLISAPALMDLEIDSQNLRFTDHCQTAPPAAAAALKRGILRACFTLKTDRESSPQPEIAIMESCGMAIISEEEEVDIGWDFGVKLTTITLEVDATERYSVIWDVRCSGALPFSREELSSDAQRSTDDSIVEHALQQQAWHAEFLYHEICDSCSDLEGPGPLLFL